MAVNVCLQPFWFQVCLERGGRYALTARLARSNVKDCFMLRGLGEVMVDAKLYCGEFLFYYGAGESLFGWFEW